MNTVIKKAGILLIYLLMTACSFYRIAEISILLPGQVNFPSNVNSLSLVLLKNEFNMPEGRLDSIDNIKLDPQFNYYILTRDYLYGLQHALQESPRFKKIVITGMNKFDSIGYIPAFDWREIIRICRNDSTDAVILLYDFYLFDSLNVISDYTGQNYDQLTSGCLVMYALTNNIFYVVLNPRKQEMSDKYAAMGKHAWYGLDLTYEDALGQLPDFGDMIQESCYDLGQKTGRMIAPAWNDDIRRIYYTQGNKLLSRGAYFAKQDKWREAAGYWRMAADSKKDKISAKAAFNMALVCEIEDKLDLAHNWIVISDSIKSNEFSRIYQQILETRLEHRTMLDEQMGFKK
jgi:hypothetical protein